MKLSTNAVPVQTNLQAQAFQVGDPTMLFNILADRIYTDKIRAVIREICCNALDASETFFVSLPSTTDPTFSVRDFGPGLSEEDVLGLYTTFFASTKRDDDNMIGGFGLGSKSPFAYSDSFTIISRQGGVKKTFIAFRDSGKVPSITLASSVVTEDPDGFEVKVPVNDSDRKAFHDRAIDVLQWFPPGCVTLFGGELTHIEPVIDRGTWMTVQKLTYNYVKMGPVVYQVDWAQVGVSALPATIVPVFNIGELELPPSRENISYNPETVARLKARYNEIVLEWPKETFEKLETLGPVAKLDLKWQLQASGMALMFDLYHKAAGHREADMGKTWTNRTWGTFFRTSDEKITIPNIEVMTYEYGYSRRSWTSVMKRGEAHGSLSFDRRPKGLFIEHDLQDVRHPRVRDRINTLEQTAWLISEGWDAVRAALSDLPDEQFIKLSSLTPPVKERVKRKRTSKIHYRRLGRYGNWHSSEDTLPNTGVYVNFLGSECLDEVGYYRPAELFGFTKSNPAPDGWMHLKDWVALKQKAVLEDPNLQKAVDAKAALAACTGVLVPMIRDRAGNGLFNLLPKETKLWAQTQKDALLVDFSMLDKPPKPKTHPLPAMVKRAHDRNPALVLLFRISSRNAHLDYMTDQLEKIAR